MAQDCLDVDARLVVLTLRRLLSLGDDAGELGDCQGAIHGDRRDPRNGMFRRRRNIGRLLDEMVPGSKTPPPPKPLDAMTVVTGLQMPIDWHFKNTTNEAVLRLGGGDHRHDLMRNFADA